MAWEMNRHHFIAKPVRGNMAKGAKHAEYEWRCGFCNVEWGSPASAVECRIRRTRPVFGLQQQPPEKAD